MKKTLAMLLSLMMVIGLFAGVTAVADSTEPTTISILGYERNISENTKFSEGEKYEVWNALEKMLADNGVKCEFEIIADSDQYKTTIQTRLASFYNIPDIFCGTLTQTTDLLDMADNELILSMNDVLGTTKGDAYNFFFGGEGDKARRADLRRERQLLVDAPHPDQPAGRRRDRHQHGDLHPQGLAGHPGYGNAHRPGLLHRRPARVPGERHERQRR